MEILKKVVKGGVMLGVVGLLLALAAPPLATMIGAAALGDAAFAHAMATPVLWTGAFFGAFGAIHAAVAPMMDWVFGKDDAGAATPTAAKMAHGHGVTIHNTQLQPNIDIVTDVAVDTKTNQFTQMIDAQRAASAGHLQLVK